MYKINTTHQFEKDLNRCIKRGYPMDDFREVIKILCIFATYFPK